MSLLYEKTRWYEEKILASLDKDKILKNVYESVLYGKLYKMCGIPFVFEILSYTRDNVKTRVIKLFNIKIYKYSKK